ncbi:MAG: V4R domain-containing protein [Candidatus Hadarchaeales archaeon]
MEAVMEEMKRYLSDNWRKAFEMWFCCMLHMGRKLEEVIPRDIRTGLPYSLLYEIGVGCGRKAGKWMMEEFHLEGKDIREKVKYSNAFFECTGAGTIEFFKEGDRRIFRFKGGTFISKRLKTGMKTCHYLAGFIAGVTEVFVGMKFRVEEVRCVSQGDEHCDFWVFPKP